MGRELVSAVDVEINGRSYPVHYYVQHTVRGARRFSCEVVLDAGDRVILDDDSVTSLQAKVARLAPATIYSRALASKPWVAA